MIKYYNGMPFNENEHLCPSCYGEMHWTPFYWECPYCLNQDSTEQEGYQE